MLAFSLLSASARAESSVEQRAVAEALFDEGVTLMKSGDLNSACPKLEQSQEVDPAVGTLLYLAECYEGLGRTASAWTTFREAASMANASGQAERGRVGEARALRLEPSLSRLVVQVAAENAALPEFKVTRGKLLVPQAAWGTGVPVDPGSLRIEASAPGFEPWTTTLTIAPEADQQTVQIPRLVPSRASPASKQPAGASEAQAEAEPRGAETQRTVGLVLGGLGVLGLGTGTYFGLRAIAKNGDAAALCGGGTRCSTPEGETRSDEALHAATLANVGFIGGGVLLASGAALFFLAPSSRPAMGLRLSPVLTAQRAGVWVAGDF